MTQESTDLSPLELLHLWMVEEFPLLSRRKGIRVSRGPLEDPRNPSIIGQTYWLGDEYHDEDPYSVQFLIGEDAVVRMSIAHKDSSHNVSIEGILSPIYVDLHHPRAFDQLYARLKTWYSMYSEYRSVRK